MSLSQAFLSLKCAAAISTGKLFKAHDPLTPNQPSARQLRRRAKRKAQKAARKTSRRTAK